MRRVLLQPLFLSINIELKLKASWLKQKKFSETELHKIPLEENVGFLQLRHPQHHSLSAAAMLYLAKKHPRTSPVQAFPLTWLLKAPVESHVSHFHSPVPCYQTHLSILCTPFKSGK